MFSQVLPACRLRNLSEILDKHVSYLRAAVALESLNSKGEGEGQSSSDGAAQDKEVNEEKESSPDDDASERKA